MSIFGPIKLPIDIENAVLTTLDSWFQTYLSEYELQAGLIALPADPTVHPLPRSFTRAAVLDRSVADNMPAIVVICPGMAGPPRQEGSGSFRTFWNVAIGVFVSANEREDTMDLVRVYTGICRTIMLQKQSLGGLVDGLSWLDESYDDDFPWADAQTVGAGQAVFTVEVAGVVNRYGGPAKQTVPGPTLPGSEWPLALTHTETVKVK